MSRLNPTTNTTDNETLIELAHGHVVYALRCAEEGCLDAPALEAIIDSLTDALDLLTLAQGKPVSSVFELEGVQ